MCEKEILTRMHTDEHGWDTDSFFNKRTFSKFISKKNIRDNPCLSV